MHPRRPFVALLAMLALAGLAAPARLAAQATPRPGGGLQVPPADELLKLDDAPR